MRKAPGLKKQLFIFLLVVTFIIGTFGISYADDTSESIERAQKVKFLESLMQLIEDTYLYDVTEDELIEGAMKGLFFNLDAHSNYYTPEEFAELNEQVEGDFGGIGLHITEQDGYVTVITPIDGTPASNAGLKAGDKIVSVDEVSLVDSTAKQASDLMRGESGTKVKLGIIREGFQEVMYLELTREIIVINPVSYEILDSSIGYIKISEFNKHTLENIVKALNEFDNKEIDRIIFDVRNNPGGSLSEVVNILKWILPEGPIVHIKEADGSLMTHESYNDESRYKLAVLVNEGSASASEIFAGAIQDRKAGTIIGTNTYGKGTVQLVLPLVNGGGVKLTIAEYLTPNEKPVNKVGITPDILVENLLMESEIDLTKMPEFDKTRKPTLNTVGLDVLRAEQILHILKYNINEPDGILDQTTFEAIKEFQKDSRLSSYGVLDFTTQDKLTESLIHYIYNQPVVDKQLEKAIEVLSN